MKPVLRCPACGCDDPGGTGPHAIVAALLDGDLDLALSSGLLDCDHCPGCNAACRDALRRASDARMAALAARGRYLARNARLQRRTAELAARRAPARTGAAATLATAQPALPSAAAAALARAKVRAAERHKP